MGHVWYLQQAYSGLAVCQHSVRRDVSLDALARFLGDEEGTKRKQRRPSPHRRKPWRGSIRPSPPGFCAPSLNILCMGCRCAFLHSLEFHGCTVALGCPAHHAAMYALRDVLVVLGPLARSVQLLALRPHSIGREGSVVAEKSLAHGG